VADSTAHNICPVADLVYDVAANELWGFGRKWKAVSGSPKTNGKYKPFDGRDQEVYTIAPRSLMVGTVDAGKFKGAASANVYNEPQFKDSEGLVGFCT
jgi:hypothetical protein